MALLKRLKASTLMETLVATVLVVVIFMVSSMLLNSLLQGNIRRQTEIAAERLNMLEYQYKNDVLVLPFYEAYESWEINVFVQEKDGVSVITLEAENPKTGKTLTNYIGNERY